MAYYFKLYKKYLLNGGNQNAIYSSISDFVIKKFEYARNLGLEVTVMSLAKWELEKAKELNFIKFKASRSWINLMKKRIKCT